MEADHARNLQGCLSDCSQAFDHFGSIADQSWQAACRARPPMCLNDAPHPRLRRLFIEENASASIDLNVNETRCKDRICGKLDWRARLRVTEADALDPAVRNPDHRRSAHGGSIKNLRRSNCERFGRPRVVHKHLSTSVAPVTRS